MVCHLGLYIRNYDGSIDVKCDVDLRYKLMDLKQLPLTFNEVGGYLDVSMCSKLYSLKGFPKRVDGFYCWRTPIEPIYNTFIQECDYETIRRFNKFEVIYTDGLDWWVYYDQLGKFLRSVDKEQYRWDY
jgi:hypothetical protein